jgi:hypothetical protein
MYMIGVWKTEQRNRGQYRMGEMMSSTLYQDQTRVEIELDYFQDRGSL